MLSDRFYMNIKRIRIAHEFVIDRVNRCEYPSGRGCYGLVCVLDGFTEYRFTDGARITVGKGDMMFLSPDSAYTVNTEKSFRHYTLNFDIYEDVSELGLLRGVPFFVITENYESIRHGMKTAAELWADKKAGYEMRAVGCLYGLLSQFYAEYAAFVEPHIKNRMAPAREYVEQSFLKPLRLETLAGLCNMSVTNFRREWKKLYTESPMAYRDSLRLNFANELLASGYYSIGEVAEKCGFDDVSYFVRFYKKHTGNTPGEIRSRMIR